MVSLGMSSPPCLLPPCSHKRSLCITSLMDMGFDPDIAMAAAEATGCDLSAAAAVLMEGTLAGGSKPVSVTG